jgi:dynactin-4
VSEDTDDSKDPGDKGDQNPNPDPETRFANLRTFYQGQMSSQGSNDKMPFTNDYTYASPNALSRIMNLYTSFSSPSTSKKGVSLMREGLLPSEGLILPPSTADEVSAIKKIQKEGWAGTCSTAQREQQIQSAYGPHFTDELRPVPYLLRTKRTKRCKTCKHIVVRPEAKVQTARFRMKMVAASYIPTLSIKPLPTSSQIAATTGSTASAATGLLQPHRTAQFILTVKNPLYERIRVTLATKAQTPGRFKHKVTILCPQFEVGASREAYADVWDDALADPQNRGSGSNGGGEGAAEAGKVFERGRNSVGVVVEVVPASLSVDLFKDAKSERGYGEGEDEEDEDDELGEDEDVLEIPVRMRVEWEAEAGEGEKGEEKAGEKVKRELGYWVVLGMGRIARE